MLLNYITGVLPDLDVYNANQMTMEELFAALLDRDRSLRKYRPAPADQEAAFKGTLRFVKAFERYLDEKEHSLIPMDPVVYDGTVLMTRSDILAYMGYGKVKSTRDQIESLNDRL
jgi:DNA helicase-2/ATP-dependent DNA helicase PcrA